MLCLRVVWVHIGTPGTTVLSHGQQQTNSHNSRGHGAFKCIMFLHMSTSSHREQLQRGHSHRQVECLYRTSESDGGCSRLQGAGVRLRTQIHCRCWLRCPGWRLLFLDAQSLCYSHWPLGCPGGGRQAASGGDGGAPEGSRPGSFQRARAKVPAVVCLKEEGWEWGFRSQRETGF